jgi:hypothetical protein
MPIILELQGQREECLKFDGCLGYIVRPLYIKSPRKSIRKKPSNFYRNINREHIQMIHIAITLKYTV